MEICSQTKDGVTPETPKMFTSLVYIMKAMKSEDLVSVYKKIQKNEICPSNNKRVRYKIIYTVLFLHIFYN